MTERERIIERLRAVDLGGGSHESLSAIAKAIYEPAGGWTIGACERLRQTLVRLLEEAEDVDQGARIIASDEGWDEGYKAGYDAGFASADDWLGQHEDAMAEHGWIRLPLGEDGEPIRIGELVDERLPFGGYAKPAPVDGMELYRSANGYGWMVKLDAENRALISPKLLRHHKQPTVEDVLYDSLKHFGAVEERTPEVDSWVCEQAVKLRKMLAGDAE